MAMSKEDTSGLMIKASAYIAKYAVEGGKVRLRPGDAGVHKKSRGGDYPAGLRAKELLVEMTRAGILQDDADNHGYAVEEMPVQMMLDSKGDCMTTTLEYNVQQCAKDALLSGIYDEPFNKVFHAFLAHNHALTVCRAVIAKQQWRLEDIQDMKISFCDEGGRLSLELITSSVNGKQLGAIVRDGFLCRVLSWKMDVEEPDAAATISTAFNEVGQAAMRTTELQAFQVLKGEIILQMSKDVGQAVAFETTVARVKSILGPAAGDPDIVQLFDFLVSNGVGKNSYIDDFLHWATANINPNKRRLRFAAFVPINNMRPLPLSKCAVAKRAYRGQPTGGYCPNPEPVWATFTEEQLTPLEELLRFFHVQCKDLLSEWAVKARLQLLGNVDIAAAHSFYSVAHDKKKKTIKECDDAVRRAMLKATYRYAHELSLHDNSPLIQSIPDKPEWIVFRAVDAPDLPPAVAAATKEVRAKEQVATANVVHFDEASGVAMNQQEPTSKEPKKVSTVVEQALPWRAWQRVYAEPAAMHGADHGSAVAVLYTLSCGVDAEQLPLEVCERNGRIHVRATRSIPANELMLPPSAANACSLVDPHTPTITTLAVDIAVRVQRNTMQTHGPTPREQSVEPAKKKVKKGDKKPDGEKKADTDDECEPKAEYDAERLFKLVPEWKVPALTTTADQATKAASAQCSCSDTVDGSSLCPPVLAPVYKVERSIDDYAWGDPASVTRGFCKTTAAMSVYWAIRRVSSSELERANKLRSKKQSFNCRFEKVRVVNICVGLVNKRGVNQARNIEVPFITNAIDVEAGEELLLEKLLETPAEARKPPKPTAGASNWKTAVTKSVKKAEASKCDHGVE